MRIAIKLVGIGGQGVVATGLILARSFFEEGYHVLQSQTYGAASRGSLSSASVIVQDEPIMDFSFEIPDLLVLLSKDGVLKNREMIPRTKMTLIDSAFDSLLRPLQQPEDESFQASLLWIPASTLAMEYFENPIMVNMITLGVITYILREKVKKETVVRNIARQWPKWENRNRKGFLLGWKWGLNQNFKEIV